MSCASNVPARGRLIARTPTSANQFDKNLAHCRLGSISHLAAASPNCTGGGYVRQRRIDLVGQAFRRKSHLWQHTEFLCNCLFQQNTAEALARWRHDPWSVKLL